jgi:hypothetical protein
MQQLVIVQVPVLCKLTSNVLNNTHQLLKSLKVRSCAHILWLMMGVEAIQDWHDYAC